MKTLVQYLIASGIFGKNPPYDLVAAIAVFVLSAVVFLGVAFPFAGIVSWVERRVWARIQSRVGPNRVGPNGFLQWLADGVKHVCKEDIVPTDADPHLFKLAPYLVVLAFVLPWAVMPFSSSLILADLNVGILYMTAVTALTVVGVLMAGWASNNKWSLIGGIRSAAQIISYEIPAGLSIFPVVLMTGTLSMQGIIQAQGWAPDHWFLFANPFTFRRGQYPVHLRAGRGQSHAVRSARGRVRARRRLRDRVLRHALPVFLHGGVGQHVRHRRDHHDAVPRRMAIPAPHRRTSS